MKLRKPDYYDRFRCIAGACKDSCCIGWEIDIDEKKQENRDPVCGKSDPECRDLFQRNRVQRGEYGIFKTPFPAAFVNVFTGIDCEI